MLDIHAHILPGVDDGAQDLEACEQMLQQAQQAGVTEIVATPHVTHAPAPLERIERMHVQVREKAEAIGITVYLGFEVWFEALESVEDVAPYCFRWARPQKVLLLEFDPSHLPERADAMLSYWARGGICPVIAHPERYAFVQEDPQIVAYMRGYGCLAQVDAGALTGGLFSKEGRTANALLRAGLVDLIASDSHRQGDYQKFAKAITKIKGRWTPFDFNAGEVK